MRKGGGSAAVRTPGPAAASGAQVPRHAPRPPPLQRDSEPEDYYPAQPATAAYAQPANAYATPHPAHAVARPEPHLRTSAERHFAQAEAHARSSLRMERSVGVVAPSLWRRQAARLASRAGQIVGILTALAVILPAAFFLMRPMADGPAAPGSAGSGGQVIAQRSVALAAIAGTPPLAAPSTPLQGAARPAPATDAAARLPRPAPFVPTRALPAARVSSLLTRANALLEVGDVNAARQVLRHVAESGSAEAALRLARLYDPAAPGAGEQHFGSSDVAAARQWYEAAYALGNTDAARHLQRLAP